MKRTVLVVAKAPAPGRSKTRLVPPLTAEQAARLQRALLLDTLATCRAEAPDTALLYANPDEAPALAALAGPEARLVLQAGRGLAEALEGGIARFAAEGPVAIVSSDIPGIPPGSLTRAFAALGRDADVVLGPALDGGYWLIAMNAAHHAPFDDIPWSTPAVLAVTLHRCEQAGLRVRLLDPWRDVDTPVDLALLAGEAEGSTGEHTARALRELDPSLVRTGPRPPDLVTSELLSGSPWRSVIADRLARPDGRETGYTYAATPRAAFVVAVTGDDEIVMVRQYRHPVRDWTLEVPAGSLDDGETPLQAAQRELFEEVGGRATSWRHLSTFYSSSAHLSLRSDAFLATGVTLEAARPEEGEHLEVVRLPWPEALARARSGDFSEGQTALAILLAASARDGGSTSRPLLPGA